MYKTTKISLSLYTYLLILFWQKKLWSLLFLFNYHLFVFLEFSSNAGEAFANLNELVEHYMEHKDLLVTNEGVKVL
jgi:hypothetical protein